MRDLCTGDPQTVDLFRPQAKASPTRFNFSVSGRSHLGNRDGWASSWYQLSRQHPRRYHWFDQCHMGFGNSCYNYAAGL